MRDMINRVHGWTPCMPLGMFVFSLCLFPSFAWAISSTISKGQSLPSATLVADRQNIIRYVEIAPMSQLPNFEAAYDAARRVLTMSNE